MIHQQHTCDCRSYELLRELARVYSGKAYSITIQRMADPSEERQIDGARSLHLE